MRSSRLFSTSLPSLDAALGEHLARGRFILSAGPTGGGKTVLAAQLTAHFALNEANVLFLSTEVEHAEHFKRTCSASCSIPYSQIKDGMELFEVKLPGGLQFPIPHPKKYGRDAAAKGFKVFCAAAKHTNFGLIESLGDHPKHELERILDEYRARYNRLPDVIVYDYLKSPVVNSKAELNPYRSRQAVEEGAKAFKSVAREHNILVVAFCQADPSLNGSKKIMPGDIAEYRSIADQADAFIGISAWRKSDDDETTEHGAYRRTQYLTVVTETCPSPKLIPVERAFEFQRFEEPRTHTPTSRCKSRSGTDSRARTIEKSSEYRGYVLARPKTFHTILGYGVPNALNLYAFLLLVARRERPNLGSSFYSRQTMSDLLGISIKQIRAATDLLINAECIDVPLGRLRQSLRYEVLDWKDGQNPANKGYFKLFRNLRDASHAELLGDPVLFRVWLYLLAEARRFPEEDMELEPGDVFLRPRVAAEKLKLKEHDFEEQIDRLETSSSVQIDSHRADLLKICNWDLYQHQMYLSAGDYEAESET